VKRIIMSIYDDRRNPYYGGGGGVVVYEIARRLARDHKVTVLAGSYPGSRSHRMEGADYVYLPVGWAGPRAGQLLFHALLPALALLKRYDLWIESFTPPYSTSFLPLFSRGRPVIGLVQMLSGENMSRKYRLPFWWIERRGLARYSQFIVLNEVDRRIILERNRHADIVVIPNGVQIPLAEEAAHGREGYILYLGRIDVHQKGLDLLFAAYAQSSPDLPLLIAGSGTPREEHVFKAIFPHRNSHVRWLGRVSGQQKENLLRNCAFLVMPSRFETFGLSALEAMSYGKPVVMFDVPGVSWFPEECGVRVPPFDVRALAEAMRQLSADAGFRSSLGRCARTVAEGHDWSIVGEHYRAVIEDALARSNNAGR
jgi:glycosyltransferase involved in cell wall biosynthesis